MTDKGMKKALRIVLQILINIILVLVIIQVFMFAYNFFYKVFTNTSVDSSDTREIQFVIVPDSSTTEIVDALADDGLIDDPYVMPLSVISSPTFLSIRNQYPIHPPTRYTAPASLCRAAALPK